MNSCTIQETLADKLEAMTDKQIIEYSEAYFGLDGRELVGELVHRVRAKNAEIYHLNGRLENE